MRSRRIHEGQLLVFEYFVQSSSNASRGSGLLAPETDILVALLPFRKCLLPHTLPRLSFLTLMGCHLDFLAQLRLISFPDIFT